MAKPTTSWTRTSNTKPATTWVKLAQSKPKNAWSNTSNAKPDTLWTKAQKNDTNWNKFAFGLIAYIYDSSQMRYDSATRYYDGIPAIKTPTIWTKI